MNARHFLRGVSISDPTKHFGICIDLPNWIEWRLTDAYIDEADYAACMAAGKPLELPREYAEVCCFFGIADPPCSGCKCELGRRQRETATQS